MPLPDFVELYELLDISQWAQRQNDPRALEREARKLLQGQSSRFPSQVEQGRVEQAGAVCAFGGRIDDKMMKHLIGQEPALVASFYDHDNLPPGGQTWLEHQARQLLKVHQSTKSRLPTQEEYLEWVLYPLKKQLEKGRASRATQSSLLKFLIRESWQDTARLPRWGTFLYQRLFSTTYARQANTQQTLLDRLRRRWENTSMEPPQLTDLGETLWTQLLASTPERPAPRLFMVYLKYGNPTPGQIEHVLSAHPKWAYHDKLQEHLLDQPRLEAATSQQLLTAVSVKKIPRVLRHLAATEPQQARQHMEQLAMSCLRWLPRQKLLPLMQAPDRRIRRQTLRLLQSMPDHRSANLLQQKIYHLMGNMSPRIRRWWVTLPFPSL